MQTMMDEGRLKQIFKEAIVEMLEEKQNLLHDLIVEAMEDVALSRAIEESRDTGTASKNEVFNILEGRA